MCFLTIYCVQSPTPKSSTRRSVFLALSVDVAITVTDCYMYKDNAQTWYKERLAGY